MMSRTVMKLAALTALSSLSLVACASGEDATTSNSASSDTSKTAAKAGVNDTPDEDINAHPRDDLKDGGTLTSSLGEFSEQQNVFNVDAMIYTTQVWKWYNPQMVLFTADGEAKPNESYITGWSADVENGNTVVTYDLNEKAKFNDDTPIDWKAFETTWIINRGDSEDYAPNNTDGYEQIKSVEPGTSDKQVKVTFDGIYPWWEGLFIFIAHPALKDPNNYNDYLNKLHPEWGAGPYTVEDVDYKKGEVVFKRNDKWWGNPGKLDKRIFRQLEVKAAINAYRNGELDNVSAASREAYSAVKDEPNTQVRISQRSRNSLLTLNSAAPALNDVKVRKAIATAIDRELMSKIQTKGLPFEEPTPPGSLALFRFQEGYNDNFAEATTFSVEESKKILDEAGWVEGADGYREKDGKPLELRYVYFSDSEAAKADATAIQKLLKDVGVKLDLVNRPGSDFSSVIKNDDFDILPIAFTADSPFGMATLGQLYMSTSDFNDSGTGTPEIDQMIRDMQKLPTAEEQIAAGNKVEAAAFKEFGYIPMFNGANIEAVRTDLANFGPSAFGAYPIEDIGWLK
ncbi:ABC transporter family substrate-binding protein [Corynebacterium aquilae]|uniref:ABC transporter substrate-binding protein n=1 Tax=Corynebacterium aquilae DSM 44791 TaxID=1431546 RepID=A0A1L7CGL8_9CORY|nr:ABC transporter family substrate-binding protein [Corynebacterium aquilae]APT85011.1 ABC transporter substrate-binding protein [Corynebacterium aquilae DSM 44791]